MAYKNLKLRSITFAKRRQIVKYEVLSHYSNGKPKCAYCGIDDLVVLCLDHINNDGAEQRRRFSYNNTGVTLCYWLRKNNYPEGYQVLCYNCNAHKEFERVHINGL